jgi:hypothetical protein
MGLDGQVFLAGESDFFLLHTVQAKYGGHPTSYPMYTGDSIPEDNTAKA